MTPEELTKLFNSLVTDIPVDPNSDVYKKFEKKLFKLSGQATYIYSIVEKRLLYCDGWEQILGYKEEEMSLKKIIELTVPRYSNQAKEINKKALLFIINQSENLEEYSFSMELLKKHKNGSEVPLIMRVGVAKAVDGKTVEILGMAIRANNLKFGKVMQYAAYGPDKTDFEENLNKELFKDLVISRKEKEALALAAQGLAYKEIANRLDVSISAIEKRIRPMFKRFNVSGLPHLISFAHKNSIL